MFLTFYHFLNAEVELSTTVKISKKDLLFLFSKVLFVQKDPHIIPQELHKVSQKVDKNTSEVFGGLWNKEYVIDIQLKC